MSNSYLGNNTNLSTFWKIIKDYIDDIFSAQVITTIDSALSSTSTNPVQNKKVKEALDTKVDKVSGKVLSTNDYTSVEKNKLANIEAQATRVLVDNALSSSSTNAIQNKVVKAALDTKVDIANIDSAISSSSENPVQNKVIKAALDTKANATTERLLLNEIPGTTQFFVFTGDSITGVLHKSGNTTIRTDSYLFGDSQIVETRTLNTGETMTITVDLSTFETIIS